MSAFITTLFSGFSKGKLIGKQAYVGKISCLVNREKWTIEGSLYGFFHRKFLRVFIKKVSQRNRTHTNALSVPWILFLWVFSGSNLPQFESKPNIHCTLVLIQCTLSMGLFFWFELALVIKQTKHTCTWVLLYFLWVFFWFELALV